MTDEDDSGLWSQIKRGVRPLAHRKITPTVSSVRRTRATQKRNDAPSLPAASPSQPPVHQGGAGAIDGALAERLRKGRCPIEHTIDLHGYNQLQAQEVLQRKISESYMWGRRCVLVITGKGSAAHPSILREKLPQWLAAAPLCAMILAFEVAKPHHGGRGAYYVLLKKKR